MNDIRVLKLWEKCTECGGDGVAVCNNPDHHFISAGGGELSRLGCPGCGHDPNFKIHGEACENCKGTGKIPIRYTPEKAKESGYEIQDDDPVWVSLNMTYKKQATVKWGLQLYEYALNACDCEYVILAIPGQGKPDPNWSPE